ncbi:hypothetical protein AB1L05_26390 [Cytobacillus horneckiae]|uniref:hypothetical protein n=1 Tax=Cytobacillus horneckiae TaxID=549687 RepID=UPI0039A1BD79
MIILVIEIEGYFLQVLLIGKSCSEQQLKEKYLQAKELSYDLKDLPPAFCKLHNFELIPYDCDIKVEFVIDIDTDRIYTPTY